MTRRKLVAEVAFVKTRDRIAGVNRALDLLGLGPLHGRHLFLKPNFNSADPPPGSSHNHTLGALVRRLQALGADRITVGDRSGMGDTRNVMQRKGIFRLAEELGFDTLVLDELDSTGWERMQVPGSHWRKGFAVARPALEADGIVQTCCLKTHRYGGQFTLSLKNSVGLVAKQVPGDDYNYMGELHSSPHQRLMIAEIRRRSPDTPVSLCQEPPLMWERLADVLDMPPDHYACCCAKDSVPGGHPRVKRHRPPQEA